MQFIAIGGKPPFIASIIDNKIYVTLTILDLENKVIGELINNVWRVNVNNFFRLNFDDNAVEIIDQYNQVAISVEIIGRKDVRVYGTINLGKSGWMIVNKEGFNTLGAYYKNNTKSEIDEWESNFREWRSQIPRIFSYEGLNYIGKRVNK